MSIRSFCRICVGKYTRFIQRQGFAVLTVLCVAVIVGSAVWTKHATVPKAAPTPPVSGAALAAELWQQSLKEAVTLSPSPTAAVAVWTPPMENMSLLRSFDGVRMVQSGITGVWQLHDAVDLIAEPGAPVFAMANGIVLSIEEKGLQQACVTVSHPGGYEVTFAGLSMLSGIQPGDPVKAGQTLGFAGDGPMDETDLDDHVHLRITKDGHAVDPMTLLQRATH